MVFQQFSFFVAWLHKTMSTHQFIDMLTCLFPYIPIAKASGFTGISDNTFLLKLDYLIAIQKLLFFLSCLFSLLSLLSESFSNFLSCFVTYIIPQKTKNGKGILLSRQILILTYFFIKTLTFSLVMQ